MAVPLSLVLCDFYNDTLLFRIYKKYFFFLFYVVWKLQRKKPQPTIQGTERTSNYLLSSIQNKWKDSFLFENADIWIVAITWTRDSNHCYHYFVEIQVF